MERVDIEFPAEFRFVTKLKVRITDINYGGHVGNDSLVSLVHEARVRFLAQAGLREDDVGGCGLIMTDLSVVFQSEIFYPDTLDVRIAIGDLSRCGCAFYYQFARDKALTEVARARTSVACFDYRRRRVVRMPASMRSLVAPESEAN